MLNRSRHDTLTKAAEAHRQALQQRLQRRIEVARAKGDEVLLRQLEKEAQYLN